MFFTTHLPVYTIHRQNIEKAKASPPPNTERILMKKLLASSALLVLVLQTGVSAHQQLPADPHDEDASVGKPTSCLRECFDRCLRRLQRARPAAGRAAGTMLKIGKAYVARQIVESLLEILKTMVPSVVISIGTIINQSSPDQRDLATVEKAILEKITPGLQRSLNDAKLIISAEAATIALTTDFFDILRALIIEEAPVAGEGRMDFATQKHYRVLSIEELETQSNLGSKKDN
jgi:hypothetical protein